MVGLPPGSPNTLNDSLGRGSAATPPVGPREKRSFKDKLRDMIQEAEVAEAQALHEQQLQDKRTLSINILIEGYPQAFIDFFELTHAPPPPPKPEESAQASEEPPQDLPPDALTLLKSQLVAADAASRADDPYAVYDAHHRLAKYFEQSGDSQKTVFFYGKCLGVADEVSWTEGRMAANLALGLVQERLGNADEAVACHERYLQLAADNEADADVRTAYTNLIQVYAHQAAEREAEGSLGEAAELQHKALNAAEQCDDTTAAGSACYKLGMLAAAQGDHSGALAFQQRYLSLAKESKNKYAEASAWFAIAECEQELGNDANAIIALETYLELTRVIDPDGQAQACCNLGIIYLASGKHEQAVMYFEKFFEVARSMNDHRLLDVARFNLGIARGSARHPAFSKIVHGDLSTLLNWKNVRLPFADSL